MPVDVFEADLPIFDAAAGLGVPIYIHSGPQLQQLRDIAYSGRVECRQRARGVVQRHAEE